MSQRQAETCYLPAPNCGRVIRLEAFYEVQAGNHSFVALIRGGTSGDTGATNVKEITPLLRRSGRWVILATNKIIVGKSILRLIS